ncbi:MAG: hypothetical protein UT34_C0001G0075 [candidate division WS6 bacterium GW2011_GWF2_39_15]|uniref:AB hydrolase-1 domain-containing protein n=1 Tax=candidate division WS6 bacterium GW2011_GWF2_39_15 TaxID=1619100 RepID=A0A0G0Q6J0_9BACT|nr:MAG: hypothetical protein UT34_C0001G0075 [candidate division WS6 bacterium GW2011_GWF2_39_15]
MKTADLSGLYEQRLVDYNGYNIATYRFGKGKQTVLCLPPFPHSGLAYIRFLECISPKELSFVTLDIPGWIGNSQNIFEHKKFRYDRMMELLDFLVESLGLETFTLMGYSFGTTLSVVLNEKYKERVDKVVLISPLLNGKNIHQDPGVEALRLLRRYELYPVASLYTRVRFKQYSADLIKKGYPQYLIDLYSQMLATMSPHVELDSIYELFSSDFTKYIPPLKKKRTMILYGNDDMPAIQNEVIQLQALLPEALYRMFPGRHEGFLLRPEPSVINSVKEFILG